jgi:hypothetical protein
MNRTLKRPMFRMGGSTGTGITSGLDAPRQQYDEGNRVRKLFEERKSMFDQTLPDQRSGFMPGSVSSFLTDLQLALQKILLNLFNQQEHKRCLIERH